MQNDRRNQHSHESQFSNNSDKFDASELVLFLAQSVVDRAEAVRVSKRGHNIMIKVAEGEEGRLIGRHGRVIQAIRLLVRSASNPNQRLNIDLDSSQRQ